MRNHPSEIRSAKTRFPTLLKGDGNVDNPNNPEDTAIQGEPYMSFELADKP
jgi:hypothetical protein